MRKSTTIAAWISDLPDDVGAIRVRVGSGRSLPVVAVFKLAGAKVSKGDHDPIDCQDLEELADQAELAAQDAGWPTEYTTARIHAYTVDGLEKRSKLFRRQVAEDPRPGPTGQVHLEAVIGRMVDGFLAMGGELRKTTDILAETLAHRESLMVEALETALASRQDAQDAEMQAYAASLVADERLALEGESEPNMAHEVLGQVAQVLMNQASGGMDAASLKDLVNSNPDILDDLVNDDELVGQVMGAYRDRMTRESQAPDNGAGHPVPEPDPTPNPMDE